MWASYCIDAREQVDAEVADEVIVSAGTAVETVEVVAETAAAVEQTAASCGAVHP